MKLVSSSGMNTIIVATDFSVAASNATRYAVDMATATRKDILLLYVYPVPVAYSDIPLPMSEQDVSRAEQELAEVQKQLLQQVDGQVKIDTTVRVGIFLEELKQVCELVKPYTVVMGSQGTTASERLLFGGHTVQAMQHLRWSLITVPPDTRFKGIQKIGLACDFDNIVYQVPIADLQSLVNDFHAELHVCNIGRNTTYKPQLAYESNLLQEKMKALQPQYHFITHNDTDEGIIHFAETHAIDLLIVLPKRHSLFNQLIHKSHTRHLVLHCHVPVMALHA